jgi:hypothetical protein
MLGWRRVFFRWDHQTIFVMGMCLLAAIGIRYTHTEVDIRYFLPNVIVSCPWIALGFLGVSQGVVRRLRDRVSWTRRRRVALVMVLLGLVVGLGWFDTELSGGRAMREQAELGQWIFDHFGPGVTFAGNADEMTLLQYYARGRTPIYLNLLEVVETCCEVIEARQPDFVLLWRNWPDQRRWAAYGQIFTRRSQLGYEHVAEEKLPSSSRLITVLVRKETLGQK